MVHEDHDWVGTAYKEVSPVFQASDYGQELLVVDIIVSFSWVEGLGVISHWAFLSCFFMFLVQDGPSCKHRCVDFQDEGSLWVGSEEDWVV